MKRCLTCGEIKPLDEFHRTTKSKDGRRAHCKPCRSVKERANLKANNARSKRWADQNREKVRAYAQRWRLAHPERCTEYARRYRYAKPDARERVRGRKGRDHCPDSALYVEVLRADPCAYCGGPAGTIDHIDSLEHGGENHWTNYTAACLACNGGKRERSLLGHLLRVAG